MFGVKNRPALVTIGALVLLGVVLYFGLTAIPGVRNVLANPNPTAEAITAAATPTPAAEPARVESPVEDSAKSEEKILTEDDRSSRLWAATSNWQTNWNRRTIDYGELLSGGPPRDGIPLIDNPQFVEPAQAEAWLPTTSRSLPLRLTAMPGLIRSKS